MAAPRLAAGQLVDVCPERGAQHWYDAEVLSVDGDDAVLRLFDMDEEDELMSISVSRFRREQLLAPFQSWTGTTNGSERLPLRVVLIHSPCCVHVPSQHQTQL